eukprot:scaffold1413_cov117-Cylindrotheca_fusiformis.AAC.10
MSIRHLVANVGRKVPNSMKLSIAGLTTLLSFSYGFTSSSFLSPSVGRANSFLHSMSSATSVATPSWEELQSTVGETPVGQALNKEVDLRSQGRGSAHVQNRKRLFQSSNEDDPPITLFRDHAGWCPYCQKTMLLIEEKQVPIKIELVPMRSYGDKPREFLQKVPNGLLPAIEVNGQIITESSVIMELLDRWHPPEDGYKPMMPQDAAGTQRYEQLARLERELFSWWCTSIFRPESMIGGGNPLAKLMGGGDGEMSGSMQGFLDCIRKVDAELKQTKGPWFFDAEYPTMIDFIYVSHVERMLASCAYWKGLNLRDPKWKLDGINRWLEAFEKKEHYLAFKSDYYTHVKDIPPQYGPGYDGGFEADRKVFSSSIVGANGSWTLPLSHDDPLQPLYNGPPLPLCVLESLDIQPDSENGAYEKADPSTMRKACRLMAAWKLAGNGDKVARFAARGGPDGAKNPRKTFGAELADPYAATDESVLGSVDEALRIVCLALQATDQPDQPDAEYQEMLKDAIPSQNTPGVVSSIVYLRDRVGVPRDLPLASGRYLRAYLNWAIDTLS